MPTASSFNNFTTSKPGVGNIAGHITNPSGAHTHKANGGSFGLPKGAAKPDSTQFRLKHTGTMVLPESSKYSRPGPKKVDVPKKDEKPIMGLVSDKNFIVSNAVENILAAPNLPGNKNRDFLKKKNYGKVPRYL